MPSSTTNSPRLIRSLDRTSPGGSLGISRESLSSFAALGLPLTMTESCSRLSWTVELAAPTYSPLTRRRWNRGPELSCRTTCPAGSTALFSRRVKRKIYVVDALHDVFAERITTRVAAMYARDGFDERRQMRQGEL